MKKIMLCGVLALSVICVKGHAASFFRTVSWAPKGNLGIYQPDMHTLVAVRSDGAVLWTKKFPGQVFEFAVSPDGGAVLCSVASAGLYVLKPDGAEKLLLPGRCGGIAWCGDGQGFSVVTYDPPQAGGGGRMECWVMNVDGKFKKSIYNLALPPPSQPKVFPISSPTTGW